MHETESQLSDKPHKVILFFNTLKKRLLGMVAQPTQQTVEQQNIPDLEAAKDSSVIRKFIEFQRVLINKPERIKKTIFSELDQYITSETGYKPRLFDPENNHLITSPLEVEVKALPSGIDASIVLKISEGLNDEKMWEGLIEEYQLLVNETTFEDYFKVMFDLAGADSNLNTHRELMYKIGITIQKSNQDFFNTSLNLTMLAALFGSEWRDILAQGGIVAAAETTSYAAVSAALRHWQGLNPESNQGVVKDSEEFRQRLLFFFHQTGEYVLPNGSKVIPDTVLYSFLRNTNHRTGAHAFTQKPKGEERGSCPAYLLAGFMFSYFGDYLNDPEKWAVIKQKIEIPTNIVIPHLERPPKINWDE